MITVGSLFSGIGGIELGLEYTGGFRARWQVEKDEFCREVLAHHWPRAGRYGDVRDLDPEDLDSVDLICGGFPCPAVSQAARGRNNGDWLWPEFSRVVRHVRPRWVLVENVSALRYEGRGMGEVLGDLAEMGYNAEWRDFPASWLGAPHRRSRIWLVAYANGHGQSDVPFDAEAPLLSGFDISHRKWPDPPDHLSVDDGVPSRVALRAYGNAVVPQVAEFIGQKILDAEAFTI